MVEISSEITDWILAYENETMTLEQITKCVRERLGVELDQHHLDNYWRSQDVEEFIEGLIGSIPIATPPADDDALVLIQEALGLRHKIEEDPAHHNNRSYARIRAIVKALDLRFRKRQGEIETILESATEPEAILAELRIATQILL